MQPIDIREAKCPSKICKSLGRSRSRLQKWVGSYNSFNKRSEWGWWWFKEESVAPKNIRGTADSEVEPLVVNVQKSLMGKNRRYEV